MKPAHSFASGLIVLLCTGLICLLIIVRQKPDDGLMVPNEKAVAMELLTGKFSGPGYFQHTALDPVCNTSAGEVDVYITTLSAAAQMPRVFEARRFDETGRNRLHHLVERLTEPAPSRLSSPRLNLARLNLALDGLSQPVQ